MKSAFPVILFCLFFGYASSNYGQTPNKQSGYKDFTLTDSQGILLLTKTGQLKWLTSLADKDGVVLSTTAPVVASTIDREGAIVIGDTNHLLQTYDSRQKTWRVLSTYAGKLTGIIFNSRNQCFLITDQGIVDVQSHTNYFPGSSFYTNNQIRYQQGWFYPPVSFLDYQDNLWLGFDHGEWGGDVFAFDTRQRAFRRLQTEQIGMTRNPVNGFCDDQKNVYMSGGVSHMFLSHGSIIRFTNGVGTPVLLSKDRETPTEMIVEDPKTGKKQKQMWTTWKGGHRIGPVAYNPSDKHLYFYSQFGIFKGDPKTNLSDIKRWKSVLEPNLSWTAGSPNAAGPAMNVLKMKFTVDGTLLFLTEHNGLGVYGDNKLRFIE